MIKSMKLFCFICTLSPLYSGDPSHGDIRRIKHVRLKEVEEALGIGGTADIIKKPEKHAASGSGSDVKAITEKLKKLNLDKRK